MAETVIIQASSSHGPIEYSLWQEDAITREWQEDNKFNDLEPGNYTVKCRDDVGCTTETTFVVEAPPILPLVEKSEAEHIIYVAEDVENGGFVIEKWDYPMATMTDSQSFPAASYDSFDTHPFMLPNGEYLIASEYIDEEDNSETSVQKFDAEGNQLWETIYEDEGIPNKALHNPYTGDIFLWIDQYTGDNSVLILDKDGEIIYEDHPIPYIGWDVLFALPDGRYVIENDEFNGERLEVYDSEMNLLSRLSGVPEDPAFAVMSNSRYLLLTTDSDIVKYDLYTYEEVGRIEDAAPAEASSTEMGELLAIDENQFYAVIGEELAVYDTEDLSFVKLVDYSSMSDNSGLFDDPGIGAHQLISLKNGVVLLVFEDNSLDNEYSMILDVATEEIVTEAEHTNRVDMYTASDYYHTSENLPTINPPSEILSDSYTEDSITISWTYDESEDIDGFNVYLDGSLEGEVGLADADGYTLTGLDATTQYEIVIRSVSGGDESHASDVTTVMSGSPEAEEGIESFESYDPRALPSDFSVPEDADHGWEITSQRQQWGTNSLGSSPDIGGQEIAAVELEIDVDTDHYMLSFDYLASTESSYDNFRLLIDGSMVLEDNGQEEWKSFSQILESGLHTVTFEYEKDGGGSDLDDRVYIDQLVTEPYTVTGYVGIASTVNSEYTVRELIGDTGVIANNTVAGFTGTAELTIIDNDNNFYILTGDEIYKFAGPDYDTLTDSNTGIGLDGIVDALILPNGNILAISTGGGEIEEISVDDLTTQDTYKGLSSDESFDEESQVEYSDGEAYVLEYNGDIEYAAPGDSGSGITRGVSNTITGFTINPRNGEGWATTYGSLNAIGIHRFDSSFNDQEESEITVAGTGAFAITVLNSDNILVATNEGGIEIVSPDLSTVEETDESGSTGYKTAQTLEDGSVLLVNDDNDVERWTTDPLNKESTFEAGADKAVIIA